MTGRPNLAVRSLAARFLDEARRTRATDNDGLPSSWRVFQHAASLAATEAAFHLTRSQGVDRQASDLPIAVDNAFAWSHLDGRSRRALFAAGANGGAS